MLKEKNNEFVEIVHREKEKYEAVSLEGHKTMQACYVRISELEASMKVLSKENDSIPAMTEDISRLQSVIDFKAGLDEKVTMLEKENRKPSALVKKDMYH